MSSAVQSDTYYSMDYGFQFTDFLYAVNHSFGAHVKKGVAEYLNERINTGFNQIQTPGNYSHPCINHIENVVDPNKELVKIILAPAAMKLACKVFTRFGYSTFHNSGGLPVSSPA